MGFQVRIDEHSQQLLDVLRTTPIEIFDKAYAGYLLFLFGAADEKVVTWFSQHVVALDSLTGKHIAFAVFASQVPIKLRTYEGGTKKRRLGVVELQSVQNEVAINKLVRSGAYGEVYSGDEIIAMTYAADELARAFGVLGELPCLIIIDGIPTKDLYVLHLDDYTVESLMSMVRKVMDRLTKAPTLPEYLTHLATVVSLIKDQSRERECLAGLMAKEQSIKDINEGKEYPWKRGYLWPQLAEGQFDSFSAQLEHLKTMLGNAVEGLASEAKRTLPILIHCDKTVRNLKTYSERFDWPLAEPFRSRYLGSYRQHVRALMPGLPEDPNMDSSSECRELISKLNQYRLDLSDAMLQLLPNEEELSRLIALYQRSTLDTLCNEIQGCRNRLDAIEGDLMVAAKRCQSGNYPSVTRIFKEVIGKKKVKAKTHAIVDLAKAFAGKVFTPEMLLKLWGLLHGGSPSATAT